MATGTLYLRPSEDVSLEHSIYPSTLLNGYLAINEPVCDQSATYIYADKGVTATSKFNLTLDGEYVVHQVNHFSFADYSGTTDAESTTWVGWKLTINNEVVWAVGVDANGNFSSGTAGTHDGEQYLTIYTEDHYTYGDEMIAARDKINQFLTINGRLPTVAFEIYTLVGGGSKSSNQYRMSQLYCELDCEYTICDIGVHTKNNGVWISAKGAYQKVDGVWVEISGDECKSILQNNLVSYIT